jgi:hypothetical protein
MSKAGSVPSANCSAAGVGTRMPGGRPVMAYVAAAGVKHSASGSPNRQPLGSSRSRMSENAPCVFSQIATGGGVRPKTPGVKVSPALSVEPSTRRASGPA